MLILNCLYRDRDVCVITGRRQESTKGLAWRRTPIPAKIALEGGNTCTESCQGGSRMAQTVAIYQPNYAAESRRECVQDVDSWNQPCCEFLMCILRLIDYLNLGSKYVENGARSIAGF